MIAGLYRSSNIQCRAELPSCVISRCAPACISNLADSSYPFSIEIYSGGRPDVLYMFGFIPESSNTLTHRG
ncbi:hypothetical protein AR158_c022R [Paramecium bursaria Chlorella virus AR158]|uniref:hypothetical protein n=1 Tax=Paramecium bursaria Chlorella virus AR158 TaxID=380598 RepID=UPI00015AA719|nr:hypothetical protein AR158_c022R [Paramecium bursaria Chlorella virus AR158]ABU43568.1 hypothetical protein AR158_c022R [Paramecium bursaria Chlorella virus AR158]